MSTPTTAHDATGALWRDAVARLLESAAREIVDKSIPAARRIQNVRRSAKEGRALLKLAPPPLRDIARAARVELRDIRKSFGAAREASVALSLVEAHVGGKREKDAHMQALMASFTERCVAEESALTPIVARNAARRLKVIVKSLKDAGDADHADELMLRRAVRFYRAARNLVPTEGEEPEEKELHALRSAIVDHRYQMELLQKILGHKSARRVKDLQKVRTDLGDYLDAGQVRAMLAGHPDILDEKLSARMKRQQERLLARALKGARALFDEKPKAFQAALEAIAPRR